MPFYKHHPMYLGVGMQVGWVGVEVEGFADGVVADAWHGAGINDLEEEVVAAGAGRRVEQVLDGCLGELAIAWWRVLSVFIV